jgi:hypothetical protein
MRVKHVPIPAGIHVEPRVSMMQFAFGGAQALFSFGVEHVLCTELMHGRAEDTMESGAAGRCGDVKERARALKPSSAAASSNLPSCSAPLMCAVKEECALFALAVSHMDSELHELLVKRLMHSRTEPKLMYRHEWLRALVLRRQRAVQRCGHTVHRKVVSRVRLERRRRARQALAI